MYDSQLRMQRCQRFSNLLNYFFTLDDFTSNKQIASNVFEVNDQQRTTVTSNLGRMRVNMSRITKKIDDMIHPHPDSKAKKFQIKKRYVRPTGETKATQLENNQKLNPAGVKKPHKTSRSLLKSLLFRMLIIMAIIFKKCLLIYKYYRT